MRTFLIILLVLVLYVATWPFVEKRVSSRFFVAPGPGGATITIPAVKWKSSPGAFGSVSELAHIRTTTVKPQWAQVFYGPLNHLRDMNNGNNPVMRYWVWCYSRSPW